MKLIFLKRIIFHVFFVFSLFLVLFSLSLAQVIDVPTILPTTVPTTYPTTYPTNLPTTYPTTHPTYLPTFGPTTFPTGYPTKVPTRLPSQRTGGGGGGGGGGFLGQPPSQPQKSPFSTILPAPTRFLPNLTPKVLSQSPQAQSERAEARNTQRRQTKKAPVDKKKSSRALIKDETKKLKQILVSPIPTEFIETFPEFLNEQKPPAITVTRPKINLERESLFATLASGLKKLWNQLVIFAKDFLQK